MALYQRKPGTVDAWQLGSGMDHPVWLQTAITDGKVVITEVESVETAVVVTPEGSLEAPAHSFLLRNDYGEIYPRRPEVFATLYEPVV